MHRKDSVVEARFCEGGHRCSPPKECCAQGCCYLYAPPTIPRSTPPPSNHVLNLFFINHWYFWCVVLAIILAFLCACSLWKRRRQLCNWDIPLPNSQSEGDSAGSCYAPPQYSRCSSFHHAPPPYTEVTSKPDLYPIVFTCNGDGIKNGASYLMVQYFRNYIVRPAGSLSATSTVDSLSSSFMCNANESNTLVPPPYSRAASPDPQNSNTSCSIPRSASHQICFTDINSCFQFNGGLPFGVLSKNKHRNVLRTSESVNFPSLNTTTATNNLFDNNSVILSRSDQEFRYNTLTNTGNNINSSNNHNNLTNSSSNNPNHNNMPNNSSGGPVNNTVNSSNSQQNLAGGHRILETTGNNRHSTNYSMIDSTNAICNSFSSIDGNSITNPSIFSNENNKNLQEISCQISHKNNQLHNNSNNNQNMPTASFISEESPVNLDIARNFSLVNSNTGSAVSSLANINSPGSPPRATSPTAEVKELLEQINRLHVNHFEFDDLEHIDCMTMSGSGSASGGGLGFYESFNLDSPSTSTTTQAIGTTNTTTTNNMNSSINLFKTNKIRPSTLQTKKKFFSKTNKGLYTPITNESSNKNKSFMGASSVLYTGRGRRSWVSRSAPTTPGQNLPVGGCIGDHSPLLNENDEDNEQNV